jgi:signal transduction histidine kinase
MRGAAQSVRPNPGSPSFFASRPTASDLSGVEVPPRGIEPQTTPRVFEPGEQEAADRSLTGPGGPQLDREKQCLRDILHELRTPIARMRILLERARQSPQDVCNYLARIENNVLRMEALTHRLLDFSRLELIEESFGQERFDLAELVSQVVEEARIEAEARRCVIQQSLIPVCLVNANYELLQRAVENVIRNSIQYTREDSKVSVVLRSPSNGVAQILVEDEGPGISEEDLEGVFKPFYRAAHACARRPTGIGLGLAISERALSLHGGSVNACNRLGGKGLQVTIRIPLSRQTSQD